MPAPTAPVTATILMLRHGQSEWNATRRWQGMADSPLTALGRQQAAETARVLARLDVTFSTLWASDLGRASETAAILGETLDVGAPIVDRRLREAHAGEWEGLTVEEIEARWPGWLGSHRRPPSFEPLASVVERALDALRDVAHVAAARVPAVALVVAHSGLIRSLVRHTGRHDERVPNLGGVWFNASSIDGRLTLGLGDPFDPNGIVVSGLDIPGEDPGEQPDQSDAHGAAQR